MGVESGHDGGGTTDRVDPDLAERSERVHVRRLDVADTLRWSWAVGRQRPELFALALAATLLSGLTTSGITRPWLSGPPEIASWAWPVYLVQLLAMTLVNGVVYLSGADAVANRSRPLATHVRTAARRLLPLLGTGVVVAVLVGLSLLPTMLVGMLGWPHVSLVFLLIPVYVFYRLLLAFPACVIDGRGPVVSVRESWLAATGTVRKVFAVGVVSVLATGGSSVLAGRFGGQYDVASTLVSAAIDAVVLPFFGLALAHLYLEGSRNR